MHVITKRIVLIEIFHTCFSYLKLYTSIPIAKLASLLQTDAQTLKSTLMTLKHKTQNVTWDGTRGALSGSFQPAPLPIDFAVDGDVVLVKDTKVSARHSTDYFVQATAKLAESIRLLKTVLAVQVNTSTNKPQNAAAGF